MKKIIIAVMCILFCFSLVSCSEHDETIDNSKNNIVEFPEGPYVRRSADWNIYSSAADLTDESDLVFIGRVTDVEFQVLDMTTALPVSEKTENFAKELYTIYTVEVLSSYKGDTSSISKIRVMGGMVGYEVEEQLAVMEEGEAYNRENGIPIWDDYKKVQCEVGGSYLFVLKQFDTGYPTIINLEQAIYALDDPAQKRTVGDAVNDIISVFGKDALSSFTEKWTTGEYAAK